MGCIMALEEALSQYPKPEIFNSDQGSQFTSEQFTNILVKHKIAISMDSKGRALDNIIIERFFRTLKYEDIYVKEYPIVKEVKQGITRYIDFYNNERFHQSLGYHTPKEIYTGLKTLNNCLEKL
jgi:putative transposase